VKRSEDHINVGVQYLWSNNITHQVQYFLPLVLLLLCALLLTAVGLLCTELLPCVYFCYMMCTVLLCVVLCYMPVAGFLARSQYPEGHTTGHLGKRFSWSPFV
jgi:hypothetical protein